MVSIKRFDISLIRLDPTIGAEIKKTRPCLIISPDSINKSRLKTIIIAPITSKIRNNFPTRIKIALNNTQGQIALDQLRAIDRIRIIKVLGKINSVTQKQVQKILHIMFA